MLLSCILTSVFNPCSELHRYKCMKISNDADDWNTVTCLHSGPVVDGVCGVFEVMATGSSRTDCSNNVRELHAIGKTTWRSRCFRNRNWWGFESCLCVTVSGANLKRKKNWFGTTIYVEVASDEESKKTAKSHSSSHPKWDERLTL